MTLANRIVWIIIILAISWTGCASVQSSAPENREISDHRTSDGSTVRPREHGRTTTLLTAAADNPNLEVIDRLIATGADVNMRDERGSTPLMLAAGFNRNPHVIDLLITAGADVHVRDGRGWTAWDYIQINEALIGTDAYWRLNELIRR